MRRAVPILAALLALVPAGSFAATETSSFVIQLGVDTTSVEHVTRSAGRIVVEQVGRAPRVLRRHFEYTLEGGAVKHVSLSAGAPGATTPLQSIDATCETDSIRMVIRNGGGAPQPSAVAAPAGTEPVAGSSPWEAYESATMRMAAAKADTLGLPIYFLGAPGPDRATFRRIGRDSVELRTRDHLDVFHLRVDRTGHILGALPISGTGKVTVTRVPAVDVDGFAANFAMREKQGAGMGALSPRDTLKVENVGGATIWVDYGSPAKRGRTVFGQLVPFGAVWRTGANAATQFRTDRALTIGGQNVPAGLYTLWTVPQANGWKLMFNTQTGQWGTDHDPAKDAYTFDMGVETLPDAVEHFTIHVVQREGGGVLQLDWDTTRASLEFKTAPTGQ